MKSQPSRLLFRSKQSIWGFDCALVTESPSKSCDKYDYHNNGKTGGVAPPEKRKETQ